MTQPRDDPDQFASIPDPRPFDRPWPTMTWPLPPEHLRHAGRLVLVTATDPDTDAPELFDALDHDAVWRFLDGRPGSPDQLAADLRAQAAEPGRQVWTVRLASGEIAGTTSFLDVRPGDANLEIGRTMYAPWHWGGAVNPEAKLLLLGCAFDRLGAGRVQLKTDARNVRSQQAIAHLGARYEGTLRRHMRRADGTMRDTVMFSIIAEDWPRARRALTKRLLRLRPPRSA